MLITANNGNFAESTFMTNQVKNNANIDQWLLRPGFRPQKDITGEVLWKIDPYQITTTIPSKGVFNITAMRGFPFEGLGASVDLYPIVNLRVGGPGVPYKDGLAGITIPDVYGTGKTVFV